MIQCHNPACQALNDEVRETCHHCQTPLIHRYLWAVGADLSKLKPGTQLTQRYRCVNGNILLDQTPEYLPEQVSAVTAQVLPYLSLAALAGRVPVPHVVLPAEALSVSLKLPTSGLLLLEQAPWARSQRGVALLPTLAEQWQGATPLRQLNWLRQMAELWSPLSSEGVSATLGNPALLRVDESWLRLLALATDAQESMPVSLAMLGNYWQPLLPKAQPPIREALAALIDDLRTGQLTVAKNLIRRLDLGVATLAQAQPVQLDLATYTDQGPTRQRNEDACFPASGTVRSKRLTATAAPMAVQDWVIVCDGIGGHEGGDVASHLAIETINSQLKPLEQPGLSTIAIAEHIRQALLAANDAIYARNNQEHRQARGRMGTTVVVGVVYPPFLFVAHVGDSRAYRISDRGFCQITLDDDVGAREARLGMALYRDALRQPSAGSLVQALGITESSQLYPSIQWHLLDDHCSYLICSDGLSDYDRVESLWWTELRTPLSDPESVGMIGRRLIDLANTYNGHDNVTVGLIALNPQPPSPFPTLSKQLHREPAAPEVPTQLQSPPQSSTHIQSPTQPLSPAPNRSGSWGRLVVLLLLGAGFGGAIAAWLWQRQVPAQPLVTSGLVSGLILPGWQWEATEINPGSYWQVRSVVAPRTSLGAEGEGPIRLAFWQRPEGAPEAASSPDGTMIPVGSVLQVIQRQDMATGDTWVYLQVCSVPAGPSIDQIPTGVAPGSRGWLPTAQLGASAIAISNPSSPQQGTCQ